MQEFLYMGGYGFYVWSAFGLTAIVLVWNWIDAKRVYAKAVSKSKARQKTGHGGK